MYQKVVFLYWKAEDSFYGEQNAAPGGQPPVPKLADVTRRIAQAAAVAAEKELIRIVANTL
jgi:hypothetical protein